MLQEINKISCKDELISCMNKDRYYKMQFSVECGNFDENFDYLFFYIPELIPEGHELSISNILFYETDDVLAFSGENNNTTYTPFLKN